MLSAILKIVAWVTGFFTPKSDPTQVQLADSNARAQEQLTQSEGNNANLQKASAARSDADAGVVRAITGTSSNVDPAANAAIAQANPGAFRD